MSDKVHPALFSTIVILLCAAVGCQQQPAEQEGGRSAVSGKEAARTVRGPRLPTTPVFDAEDVQASGRWLVHLADNLHEARGNGIVWKQRFDEREAALTKLKGRAVHWTATIAAVLAGETPETAVLHVNPPSDGAVTLILEPIIVTRAHTGPLRPNHQIAFKATIERTHTEYWPGQAADRYVHRIHFKPGATFKALP